MKFRSKPKFHSSFERGVSLVENLVSLSILAIVISSASTSMIMSFHGNSAARTYAGVISDIQGTIDGLRNSPYNTLLNKFATIPFTDIVNNQTAFESSYNPESQATYTITYTAVKRSAASIPDAVKVKVSVVHKMGRLGQTDSSFETEIAQSG